MKGREGRVKGREGKGRYYISNDQKLLALASVQKEIAKNVFCFFHINLMDRESKGNGIREERGGGREERVEKEEDEGGGGV
jgi:hypothetical protein